MFNKNIFSFTHSGPSRNNGPPSSGLFASLKSGSENERDFGAAKTREKKRDFGCAKTREKKRDFGCAKTREKKRDFGCAKTREKKRDFGCAKTRMARGGAAR